MRPTVLVLIFFITACAPMAEIDVEVIDPAEFTFPVYVQRLAFINRIVGLPVLIDDTTNWNDEEEDMLNKVASLSAFKGVRAAMVNSPMYRIDTIRLLNYEPLLDGSNPAPMTIGEITYLNKIHPADALICLEKLSFRDSTDIHNREDQENRIVHHWGVTKSLWRIYDVSDASVLDEYTHSDTVTAWAHKDVSHSDRDTRLQYMGRLIRKGVYLTGFLYGNRISPAWIQVPRYYYRTGGKEMRKAARKAGRDEWNGAAEIWKKLAYEEKEKAAARASFNMALVCEMEDLMVPAMDWANKSMSIRPDTLTRDYIKILKQRSEQLDELEKQVPEKEI